MNGRIATAMAMPLGLIGCLALVAAAEVSVARLDDRWTSVEIHSWRDAGASAATRAVGADLLCLGDSFIKMGLAAPELERRTGRSSYNLAACAAPAPVAELLLRRALDAGARPSTILVGFDPNLLSQGSGHFERLWPELATWPELARIALWADDGDFLARVALAKAVPAVKVRAELRAAIVARLAGSALPPFTAAPAARRNWSVNRGSHLAAPAPEFQVEVEPAYIPIENVAIFPPRWRCHPTNAIAIDRILKLASSRGIRVVWVVPPFSPHVTEGRRRVGADRAFTRFVEAILARYPGVTLADARSGGYPHRVFRDSVHLDARGASALSTSLGDALAATGPAGPSGARLALAPYREPAGPPLDEDTNWSALALESRAEGVRR